MTPAMTPLEIGNELALVIFIAEMIVRGGAKIFEKDSVTVCCLCRPDMIMLEVY
jgi:hypothetical protein